MFLGRFLGLFWKKFWIISSHIEHLDPVDPVDPEAKAYSGFLDLVQILIINYFWAAPPRTNSTSLVINIKY